MLPDETKELKKAIDKCFEDCQEGGHPETVKQRVISMMIMFIDYLRSK